MSYKYDGMTVPVLRKECDERKIIYLKRNRKADLIEKLMLHDEITNTHRDFEELVVTSVPTNKEEPLVLPPVAPRKDDKMPEHTHFDLPDAGKALSQLMEDLDEVVHKYMGSDEEDFPGYKAQMEAEMLHDTFVSDYPGKKQIADSRNERIQRQIDTESTRRFNAQQEVEDHNSAETRRRDHGNNHTPPFGGGGGHNNDGAHASASSNGDDKRSMIGWIAAAILAVLFIGVVIWALSRDDDDNDSTPASGNSSTSTSVDVNDCPKSVRDECKKIANDIKSGKITLAEGKNKIVTLISEDNEDDDRVSNGTNTSSNNGSSLSGVEQVIISSPGAGGPNLDAIDTGECEVLSMGTNSIHIRSGRLGQCTHTFSNLPNRWQMTVDSVYHAVDGKGCTGCTQGFELGDSVTVFIKDGAARLGPPEVARARYCTAYTEGLAYGHDNAHHGLPLSSWKSCSN